MKTDARINRAKRSVVTILTAEIARKGLRQTTAARRLHTNAGALSRVARAQHLDGFTLDRLIAWCCRLGLDIDVVVWPGEGRLTIRDDSD